MKKHLVLLLCFVSLLASGQTSGGMECSAIKKKAFSSNKKTQRNADLTDNQIDVKYLDLNIQIDFTKKYLFGHVSTIFLAHKASLNTCIFNLTNVLKVDSVFQNRKKTSFKHSNNKIEISLNTSLQVGQATTVDIYYQGNPPTSQFGSFSFGTHGSGNWPVVWSLSEPYGASDWWPCKDNPDDKIDSSQVSITMPKNFVSVSNGTLQEVIHHPNGTDTYRWKNKYPIAHYLISIACSNYSLYQTPFVHKNQKMPVDHYIYPELLNTPLKKELDKTVDMLGFFSDIFGTYPFIKEKYGHAMCNFGGGMEHQTISSMGGFSESLIAHELAHQWFGNMVTCKTWSDIFVNEAFASYAEALYEEHTYGQAAYKASIADYMQSAKKTQESIFIAQPEDENSIFNYNLTYAKGASVLHMLRGVLGDSFFFKTLNRYLQYDFSYKTASIDDFRGVAEAVSKQDLRYFFEDWIYGKSYPKYHVSWKYVNNNSLKIEIGQQIQTTQPNFFRMPVEILFKFKTKADSIITRFVDKPHQVFLFEQLGDLPTDVIFDPNDKILKDITVSGQITATEPLPNKKTFIFPNPVQDEFFSIFPYSEGPLEVYDTAGKWLNILTNKAGTFDISSLPNGEYILKRKSSTGLETYKISKQ
jgi:aminopeptidase N